MAQHTDKTLRKAERDAAKAFSVREFNRSAVLRQLKTTPEGLDFLRWLLEISGCRTMELTGQSMDAWNASSQRHTDYTLGAQNVGEQILAEILNTDVTIYTSLIIQPETGDKPK